MTTDIERYKMNTDFWQASRGPPLQPNELLQLQSPPNGQSNPSNNNNNIDSKMDQMQTGGELQHHAGIQGNPHAQQPPPQPQQMRLMNDCHPGDPPPNDLQNPNPLSTQNPPQQQQNQNQNLMQSQQQPPSSATPNAGEQPGENSQHEAKFNAEKLVNEIQVIFLIIYLFWGFSTHDFSNSNSISIFR
jgi:hypothetical protein